MTVFSIHQGATGFLASANGVDAGNKIDASGFRVGTVVTGLARTFGDAVNGMHNNGIDITTPATAPRLGTSFDR